MRRRSLVLALLLASSGVPAQPESLYQQAVNAERDAKNEQAVKLYVRAARAGDHKAATRLSEIYDKGIPGVSRDYAESLKWQNAARILGGGPPLIGDFPNRGR
jgi:TPR repeat protein